VRLLLDTHVFLWLQTEPERLGEHLAVVEDSRTQLLVSAASAWEIAIKWALGRLPLPQPPDRYVPERIGLIRAQALAIEHADALAVSGLEPLHRDPFDRLLVAQAGRLGVPILTADPVLAAHPVETVVIAR
jgi:PIN domain nuclease of toxin-antitoxin system